MAVTPDGLFSEAIERLGLTIAQSATWAALCDPATPGDRLVRIGNAAPIAYESGGELLVLPRGMLGQGKGFKYSRNSTTGWEISGPLQVLWDMPRSTDVEDDEDEVIEFGNRIGLICEEVAALVATFPPTADVLHGITEITPDSSRRTSDSWQWLRDQYQVEGDVTYRGDPLSAGDIVIIDFMRGFSEFQIEGAF